ncbi:acyltransferase family protein [Emcibacter sp.]|uniref:acyltransferase family protein n=1 Tax=Emcibacter sp. TaxID=1979954 RepID=UPI003A93FAA8
MTRSFSIYLDLLRFFAAFLVLLFHSRSIYNPHMTLFSLGHEAVIIFFVLSGYVIAFTAETKEKTMKGYAVARMARIYSVAIPAILITALVDFVGFGLLNAAAYPEGYQAWDLAPVRVLAALLFTGEIWTLSIQLFSNVPYWSLNYEVWYYIGFAFLAFVEGRKRFLLFAAVCLMIGPKILLLMPLWWLGVYIYKAPWLRAIGPGVAGFLFFVSIAGIAAYISFDIGKWGWNFLEGLMGETRHRDLAFSRQFISDYYLGLVVATHFVAVRGLCDAHTTLFDRVEKPIRNIAGSTFTLYLLHQPLLLFFHAAFYQENTDIGTYLLILALTVTTTYLVALVTENKKHVWKRWIQGVFDFLDDWINTRHGTIRGLIRLMIANFMWRFGPYRKYGRIDAGRVRRLVFVCHGNICRSPFGHHLMKKLSPELPVVSMGLATRTGMEAYPTAVDVAGDFDVDLNVHAATDLQDFEIRDGDLFLVMEDRHIRKLSPHLKGHDVQIALLGLWARPRFALLYDPHRLSREYFNSCFNRIHMALDALKKELEASRAGS